MVLCTVSPSNGYFQSLNPNSYRTNDNRHYCSPTSQTLGLLFLHTHRFIDVLHMEKGGGTHCKDDTDTNKNDNTIKKRQGGTFSQCLSLP